MRSTSSGSATAELVELLTWPDRPAAYVEGEVASACPLDAGVLNKPTVQDVFGKSSPVGQNRVQEAAFLPTSQEKLARTAVLRIEADRRGEHSCSVTALRNERCFELRGALESERR